MASDSSHFCLLCARRFASSRGLAIHSVRVHPQVAEKSKMKEKECEESDDEADSDSDSAEASSSSSSSLPTSDAYPMPPPAKWEPHTLWCPSGPTLAEIQVRCENAYEKMITWKRNLWRSPSGALGKEIDRTLASLINDWTAKTNRELVSLNLAVIFPLSSSNGQAKM